MKDRDQGVRTAVVNALRGRISTIDQLTMGALVESPHEDVRKFLAESLVSADADAFDEHGFDLLIDENPNVRASTIRSFGVRRQTGWLKVISTTLLQ